MLNRPGRRVVRQARKKHGEIKSRTGGDGNTYSHLVRGCDDSEECGSSDGGFHVAGDLRSKLTY